MGGGKGWATRRQGGPRGTGLLRPASRDKGVRGRGLGQ